MSFPFRRAFVASLLFCSGFCALIYQTAWLREFRMVFGASTAATAAVLGIFMAGLGLGSACLGRRSERWRKPLAVYGWLEIGISISAALTPFLLLFVRWLYIAAGGSLALGDFLGTVVRLILAALVLAVPTILMGGTLPAVARAVESEEDVGRRSLGLLYGVNTLGAVSGAALATFFLFETFGNRVALWMACGLNVVVAMIARSVGSKWPEVATSRAEAPVGEIRAAALPWRVVLIAAAVVGFAFMLMELVWYRMLGPILGGSTFTFGLILTVALLGIGIGGAGYALLAENRQPTAAGFAGTCALEALCIAVPFFLGDRIAMLALQLRELGALGFGGMVMGWGLVAAIVVLPAAIVAGYQFPMLIGLLGRGSEDVGRHTGAAYAANTAGAIVGSLAGGFGLLPWLTAPGAWKLVVVLLCALAASIGVTAIFRRERMAGPALVTAGVALAMIFSVGPTAAWRHSGIGAGRAVVADSVINSLRDFANYYRRTIAWECEGIESSVGLSVESAYAFVINGKVDGNSRGDAGTQVMGGLVGTFLHPAPKRALVIGLGTGSSAGWIAKMPGIEQVDVIEFEPAVLEIARYCAPVNANVLGNPKVKIHIGDAREVLLTTAEKYDIIFSEPSNPYRAGIASMFTREFYEAATERLKPGGIFCQWVQAYDIDGAALRTVYATLGSVFPAVQTWCTQSKDLLLIATREPLTIDIPLLRQRLTDPNWREPVVNVWRLDTAEGFLAHFLADDALTRSVVERGETIATDDRNDLEYGFARGVGRNQDVGLFDEIIALSREKNWHIPASVRGEIDWDIVDANRPTLFGMDNVEPSAPTGDSQIAKDHRQVVKLYTQGRFAELNTYLSTNPIEPLNPFEVQILAMTAAELGIEAGLGAIERLRAIRPSDADAIKALYLVRRTQWDEAADVLERTFKAWRSDPWVMPSLASKTLNTAVAVARNSGRQELAMRMFEALREPFIISLVNGERRHDLLEIAKYTADSPYNAQTLFAVDYFGPHVPWTRSFHEMRVATYEAFYDSRLEAAQKEAREFLDEEPIHFLTR